MLTYSLTFEYAYRTEQILTARPLFPYLIQEIQHGTVSKMDNQKATESTGSSSGEISERTNSKTEKTHQKITLSTFEKRGIQEARLWWRRFTQYIEMSQIIDLNIMTTDREILQNYRDELEHRIKDLLIWALGESAITEMTRTVRDNYPN